MAHRRGLLFLLPLLAAAGFAILIAIITVVLNIFLGIFADDVAGWITEMPRMNQYQYVKPEVFLCADDNPTYCKEVCDLKGNGWMFWIDGDRFLCQSPRDLSLDKSLSPLALIESFEFYDLLPLWVDRREHEQHEHLLQSTTTPHLLIDLSPETLNTFDGVLRW